jgi:hypothetical protein
MGIDNLDEFIKKYGGYLIIVVIAIIASVFLLTKQGNWPIVASGTLGFPKFSTSTEEKVYYRSTTQIKEANYNYEEAIESYDGLRIQIAECVALPSRVTYKNGTRIMLDAKSPHAQKISIGSRGITLQPFSPGYITLQANNLPATLSINCESQGKDFYNIATIILQK